MTEEMLQKEKESLGQQYEEIRDRMNQVLGAMLWVQQRIDSLKKAPDGQ